MILVDVTVCQVNPAMPTWDLSPDNGFQRRPTACSLKAHSCLAKSGSMLVGLECEMRAPHESRCRRSQHSVSSPLYLS